LEQEMADNRSQIGEPDRSRVAAEHYEVQHWLSGTASAPMRRELIERFGNDRYADREAAVSPHLTLAALILRPPGNLCCLSCHGARPCPKPTAITMALGSPR
jgi:hypothetical protein